MKQPVPGALLAALFFCFSLQAQNPSPDTSRNNLVHAPGYRCSAWGELPFQKSGNGPKTLLLLAGWGFDAGIFQSFVEQNKERYTMYAFTLPGYGQTPAYPMPPEGSSYGEGYWLKGVAAGLLRVLETEHLERPVLVAHFAVATHLALEMAAEHPDKFEKVVIVGGPADFYFQAPYDTLSRSGRVRSIDQYMAPKWFKTVSNDTWLKGNYPPALYAADSLLGRQLFEAANSAPLPVQIRYLCELWAADMTFYEKSQIPVLAIVPNFPPAMFQNSTTVYLKWFTEDWTKLAAKNPRIRVVHVDGVGCNVMNEKPELLRKLLE